jgi:hypothetical protein
MLVRKQNAIGLDYEIDLIQKSIYNYLTTKKGYTNYESYPRAYINEHKGNSIPEYSTDKKDYIELLFNDKFSITSYFVIQDNREYINGQHFEVEGSIIFQANIKELYTSVSHRADEEMNKDCFNAVKKALRGLDITNMVTGKDNVYSDFSFDENTRQRLSTIDLSQNHVLKINFTLKYKYCNE